MTTSWCWARLSKQPGKSTTADQKTETFSAFDFPVLRSSDLEADLIAFAQRTAALQGRDVNKHILSAALRRDEAEALVAALSRHVSEHIRPMRLQLAEDANDKGSTIRPASRTGACLPLLDFRYQCRCHLWSPTFDTTGTQFDLIQLSRAVCSVAGAPDMARQAPLSITMMPITSITVIRSAKTAAPRATAMTGETKA